jgi:phage-related protein
MKSITILDESNNLSFTFYDNLNGSILREFEGFEFSDVNSVIEEVASNGAFFSNSKFGKRRVSWTGDLISDAVFTLRRTLLKVLRQTGEMKLIKFTTYDDLALQFYADIVKLLNPYTNSIHTFLIEAVAPDWRFYSQTLNELTIESDETLQNAGNENTEPTLIINGPGSGFTVENVTTGESFYIDYTLLEGETIEIDMTAKTVLFNGLTNIYDKFTGDFFSLVPGSNEITLDIDSDSGAETNLVISWRDAYRGI